MRPVTSLWRASTADRATEAREAGGGCAKPRGGQVRARGKQARHAPEIERQLDEWVAAKRNKDFETADRIREERMRADVARE